jgi:hypothetical protein
MVMKKKATGISRRSFIGKSTVAATGFTIVPSRVVSGLGYIPPSDKLDIAGIGMRISWSVFFSFKGMVHV